MHHQNRLMSRHLGKTHRPARVAMAAALLLLPATMVLGQCESCSPEKCEIQKSLPGPIRLLLPPRIYAVPGIEMNVYFDNICLVVNRANYVFDVICDKGIQQAERWTIMPADADVGQHSWAVEVRDQENRVIARAESVLQVVPKNAGNGVPVTFLAIGASETHAAVYPAYLLARCRSEGNPRLTLVGHVPSQANPDVRIEGYGGWTAQRFMTHFKADKRPEGDVDSHVWNASGSPFLYSDGQGGFKADFASYCREFNQGRSPDFITITLGGNDTFRATDETIEATIDTMLTHFDAMVDMIRQVRKDTKIGVVLMYPPAGSQDAFGANYRCGQTQWQCKRNLHRVAERVIEHYGNRQPEAISLVPVKLNLDCEHNFPTVTQPWNAQTQVKGTRLSNGLHPVPEGYRQIGDTIYCWMKSLMASTGK